MIIAVGKPVIAKLADVTSRATSYLIVLCFYVLGYIVIASAHDINTIAAGIVLYAVGYTGLQLLTQIIIADITTMRWRGFVSSLVSMPFVVNGFIGPNISTSVLEHAGWRWGCESVSSTEIIYSTSCRRHVRDSGAGDAAAVDHYPVLG